MATAKKSNSNNQQLSELYQLFIAGKQKAIAAFVVAGVGTFLARHGVKLDVAWTNYLIAAVVAVLAHLGVYFTQNA